MFQIGHFWPMGRQICAHLQPRHNIAATEALAHLLVLKARSGKSKEMVTVYHYPACSTCKKALKWLAARQLEVQLIHIVDVPPKKNLLSRLLKETGLPYRKLFNTSGELYRSGGYKEKLTTMTETQAVSELAAHGKLIKRPLVFGDGVYLVGFKEADYELAFGAK